MVKHIKSILVISGRVVMLILFFIQPGQMPASGQTGTDNAGVVLMGLQMQVTSDIDRNLEQILEGLGKAAAIKASFLVTPEGSLSGYNSHFNQDELSKALESLTSAARQINVGLMMGTCYKETVKGKEYCYNQVRVYSPSGKFEGAYSKILRCSPLDLPGTGEMNDYVEGDLKVFDLDGIKFGFLICNDLWATPGYTTIPKT